MYLLSAELVRAVNHDDDDEGFFAQDYILGFHAAAMLIGWAFLLNIGAVFGRYLKHPPRNGK